MKTYLAIKFHEDCRNRELIEQITIALQNAGLNSVVMIRDYERWGEVKFNPEELMNVAFKLIDESEILVVEFSEKGVGLGIEAGYACASKKPVIVIAKRSSYISTTLRGIAKEVIFYNDLEELTQKLKIINL